MLVHRASARPSPARPARRRGLRRRTLATGLALVLLLVACGDGGAEDGATEAPGDAEDTGVHGAEDEGDDRSDSAAEDADDGDDEAERAGPAVDPAEVGADELGAVPVLMYHRLLDSGGSEYDLTPEEYREELEWLFDNRYAPVRLKDLVRGEFDVPAGWSPVVLTFDDSTSEQAQLADDGDGLDPETSLGILVEVAERYDEVEPHASVYVISSSLFGGTGDGPRIVETLHELGMEIGSHSHNHENLATLGQAEVQRELATTVVEMEELLDDAEVVTLSLPLGVFPEERELAVSGSADVGDYEHEGVLLVGSNPAPSPFAEEFDIAAIPRIRSSPAWDGGEPDFGSAFWLEQMDAGAASYRRYVSDGDPETISFPAERADQLDPAFEDRANPY